MRRPRTTSQCAALPSWRHLGATLGLGLASLVTTPAYGQPVENQGAAPRTTPTPSAADAQTTDADAADAAAPPVVIPPEEHLGGAPPIAGGEPPRHGMCACDLTHRHTAAHASAVAALVAAAVSATARRRRPRP